MGKQFDNVTGQLNLVRRAVRNTTDAVDEDGKEWNAQQICGVDAQDHVKAGKGKCPVLQKDVQPHARTMSIGDGSSAKKQNGNVIIGQDGRTKEETPKAGAAEEEE